MCVGFWALNHPTWSLILCANRDEYLDRPALPAAWHNFPVGRTKATTSPELAPGNVLSGIDVQAGGTWMGINRAGRIAFLTNITEPTVSPHAVSRGEYVASFLDPDDHNLLSSRANSLSEFLDLVVAKPGEAPVDVGGLNLLLFEPKFVTEDVPTSSTSTSDTPGPLSSSPERKAVAFEAAQMSNSGTGTAIRARPLSSDGPRIGAVVCCVPGDQDGGHNHQTISFGGLSNAIDGSDRDGLGLTDPWTKVIRGRGMLENILTSYPDDEMLKVGIDDLEKMELRLVEDLMRLLGTQSPNGIKARKDFRENIFVPPIELQTYATTLSAANRNKKWYGTRLSTVILVRRATGEVLFVERDRLRANSAIVQSKSTRGDGDSGVGLNVMLSTPDILTADEGRAAQRLFRFTLGE